MFQLDEDFLVQMGLGDMPEDEKKAFVLYVYQELELRIGTELSKDLSDQQMDEFEQIVKEGEQPQVESWLQQNCPRFKDVIAAEMETIRQEIMASRDKILSQAEAA
jgi:hypothetical protein